MYQDYKDLLSAFHAHGVKYLIVGGYAVIFHAQPALRKTWTFSYKRTLPTRRRSLRPSPNSAQRWRDLPRKISQNTVVSFVSDAIRTVSIFFPTSLALTSRRPGNAGLKP